MVGQPEHNRRKFVYLLIPLMLGILALTGWLLWRGYLDSIDPAAAQLGSGPTLKEIRSGAGQEWQYLFSMDHQIIATDINGKADRLILDIQQATHDVNSALLPGHRHRISPDGRMLAVTYNNGVGPSGCSYSPLDKLLVFDLLNGTYKSIPNSQKGIKFDGSGNVYWLSPMVIVMEMVRCAGTAMGLDQMSYFLYDLQDPAAYQIIDADQCNLRRTLKPDSHVLLLANLCTPSEDLIVWAIDNQGKRNATADEAAFFNHSYLDCNLDDDCIQHLLDSNMPDIRIEPVSEARRMGAMENGFGRPYDPDWDIYNIYMNDQLVRAIESVTFSPRLAWDAELQMFLFSELDGVYQLDAHGDYRFWHAGEYIGKVPVGIIPESNY